MSSLVATIPWLLAAGPAADALGVGMRRRPGSVVGSTAALVVAVGCFLVLPSAPAADGWFVWDRLGGFVAVFVLAMSVVVRLAAARAMAGDVTRVRFDVLAAGLAAAAIAVATAAHPYAFALAWASVTPLVWLLVRYDGRPATRGAARMAAGHLALGDAALAVAAIVAVLSLGVDQLRPGAVVAPGPTASLVAGLLVVAALARAAAPPLHRWLTSSVAAPTSASALLHAGVVNGGGLLLVRWSSITYQALPATVLAAGVGVLACLVGVAAMQTRADIKSALVWSTIGQMGFMVLQAATGLAGPAIAHLVGHGMYKAHLFLASGSALEGSPSSHRDPHSPAWVAVSAVVAAVITGLAFWVVRPDFLAAGWVVVLPGTFLTVTLAVALAPWLPGPRAQVVAACAGAAVMAVLAVAVTAGVDRLLEPSLPGFVPDGAGALAVVAVGVALAGAAALLVLRDQRSGAGDWAYTRSLVAGVPPAPISVSRGERR